MKLKFWDKEKKDQINKSAAGNIRTLYLSIVNNDPVVFYDFNSEDYISKGYAGNGEIYSIIEKIVNKINLAEPYLYIDNGNVKNVRVIDKYSYSQKRLKVATGYSTKKLSYVDDKSDLAQLLKKPNELQTWREFITLVRIYYFVQGEVFIYKVTGDDGCAISLHLLPPHRMKPIIRGGELSGWIYVNFAGQRIRFEGEDLQDLLHFKKPNPLIDESFSHFRGFSPLTAGLKYLKLDDVSIEAWVKSMENEGAKGIVSPNHANPDLWLTPDQVIATQKKIEEKIHGTGNRNKVAVSGMPLQYSSIGLSPEALNIVKGLDHSQKKLCELWGVPPILFESDPTYQNQKTASERFVKEVILPYINIEQDKLNYWLIEPFSKRDEKKYVLDYDLFPFEELRLDHSEVETLLKIHTINEVRVMTGSDELPDEYANQVFIPNSYIPLSDYNVEL